MERTQIYRQAERLKREISALHTTLNTAELELCHLQSLCKHPSAQHDFTGRVFCHICSKELSIKDYHE